MLILVYNDFKIYYYNDKILIFLSFKITFILIWKIYRIVLVFVSSVDYDNLPGLEKSRVSN